MNHILDALATVIAGPLVGVEFAVAAFANPRFARLPDDSFRVARGEASRVLGRVMPFWYIATQVLLVAAAIGANGVRSWLAGTAAVLMAAIVLLTVTVLVPINNRIAAWSAGGEPSRDLAARWDRLHWVRVAALLVVFVLLTVAIT